MWNLHEIRDHFEICIFLIYSYNLAHQQSGTIQQTNDKLAVQHLKVHSKVQS